MMHGWWLAGLALLSLTSPVAWAYETIEVTDGGSIVGTVRFRGAVPARKRLEITTDKDVCGKHEKLSRELVVGADGRVQYAVVSIVGIVEGKGFSAAPLLDQKDCEYEPHVTLVVPGKPLDIKNSDGINHNVHAFGKSNPEWNKGTPGFFTKQNRVLPVTFEKPEYVRVGCDVHAWMKGWIVVMENPYYAVTDAAGTFSLTDVPPGQHDLKVWHETLGEQTIRVSVPARGEAKADFELPPK